MKHSIRIILAAAVIIIGAMDAMAIEEAAYNVLKKDNNFEIRDYTPHILAETVVEGDLEEAETRHTIGFFAISPAETGRAKKWR